MAWRFSTLPTILLTIAAACAQSDENAPRGGRKSPPREFRSENGRFELRIEPGRRGKSGCKGTLRTTTAADDAATPDAGGRPASDGGDGAASDRGDDGRAKGASDGDGAEGDARESADGDAADRAQAGRERDRQGRSRWSRTLVNELAPAQAAIRDDGRYVVTLGEFPGTSGRNALVIYGARGELLRHFLLIDMLEGDDWEKARSDSGKMEWLEGAEWEFTERPEHFVLKLRWGAEVRVDLKTLQLVDGDKPRNGARRGRGGAVPEDVLRALGGGESHAARNNAADDEAVRETLAGLGYIDADAVLAADDDMLSALRKDLLARDVARGDIVDSRELLEQAVARLEAGGNASPEVLASLRRAIEAAKAGAAMDVMALDANALPPGLLPIGGDSVMVQLDQPGEDGSIVFKSPDGSQEMRVLMAGEDGEPISFEGATYDPKTGAFRGKTPDGQEIHFQIGPQMGTGSGEPEMSFDVEGEGETGGAESAAEPPASHAPPPPDPANPTNYMDWLRQQTITAGENASPLYNAAIGSFVPFEGDQTIHDAAIGGDAAALNSPEITAWLDANQDAIRAARAGTKLDYRGEEPHSPDGDLIGVLLPQLSPMRSIARAMSIEGRRMAADGDVDGAVREFLDLSALGAHAGNGPTLIENLVGTAIQSQAQSAFLDLMEQRQGGDFDYGALAGKLEAESRAPRPMSETILGERAMYLDMTQRLFSPGAAPGEYTVNPEGAQYFQKISSGDDPANVEQTLSELSQRGYQDTLQSGTQFYDRLSQAVDMPYPQAMAALQAIESEVGTQSNPLLRTLAPSLSRAHQIRTRLEADRRGTQLVANLMAYQQQHGTLPDSLEAFGGRSFAVDPFTNQPFRYQRTADGFQLYSPGMDGADDGGAPGDSSGKTGDHVIWPRVRP